MRKKFLTALYLRSQRAYTSLFKSTPEWGLQRADLLQFEPHTIGYHLGCFLEENQFELIPKVEQHDIYHLLTGYSTAVEDEIALQFLCFGNGKRSLYLIGALIIGTVILPEFLLHYYQAYRKGRDLRPFFQYDYRNLLHLDFSKFRKMIVSKQKNLAFDVQCQS